MRGGGRREETDSDEGFNGSKGNSEDCRAFTTCGALVDVADSDEEPRASGEWVDARTSDFDELRSMKKLYD